MECVRMDNKWLALVPNGPTKEASMEVKIEVLQTADKYDASLY